MISAARPARPAGRPGRPLATGVALALALGAGTAVTGSLATARPALAIPVPATPAGLPAAVESYEPYVGQAGCDPVAKPGVLAFQRLLLATYPDSGSLGIVRDCGIGGQSEHKEGRAFDWAMSVNRPNQVAEVATLTSWLLAPQGGQPAANARRFGIMYMIWNHQIWKAYQPEKGWQPYTGPIPHTDHVHFSFGWNGAKGATSWWSKRVAPVDYGPYSDGQPTPPPVQAPPVSVTPVERPENLGVVATYGGTTLRTGSSGTAVEVVQRALEADVDGDFGPQTEGKVKDFQGSQDLPETGVFGPTEWARLFPRPTLPFGVLDAASMTSVQGWAADADTTQPVNVQVTVDDRVASPLITASRPVPGLDTVFPTVGTSHGYSIGVDVPGGRHTVCVWAVNVGPGSNARTSCRSVTVAYSSTRPGHWVNALYVDFLGRTADDGGLEYWYDQLQYGGVSRQALAYRLATSDEYLRALVTKYYVGILGRQPDAGGLEAWRAALARGTSPAAAATAFYASPENYARAGGTDAAWVDGLYRSVLGRTADAGGRAYWAGITASKGRTYVAGAFYGGQESLQRRVGALYQSLLGRPADTGGMAGWVPVVAQQGDLALASFLASSAEYDARAQRR